MPIIFTRQRVWRLLSTSQPPCTDAAESLDKDWQSTAMP